MTQEHPITPPPELLEQWQYDYYKSKVKHEELIPYVATQAARWGADQELLVCGKYLEQCAAWEEEDVTEMYNHRRPKPLSLKEQGLKALDSFEGFTGSLEEVDIIRRALESLPE